MSALTLLIGLAFLAGLAVFLAIWLTLTLPTRAAAMREREATRPAGPARRSDVSNDAVRGAKAPRKSMPLDMTQRRTRKETPRAPAIGSATRIEPRSIGTDPKPPARPEGDPFDRFLERGRNKDEF